MDRYEQFERDQINSTLAREAYSKYLQRFTWDYFITVTFRRRFTDSIKAHEAVWERFGRTKVEEIRSSEDVASYCAKYVVKRLSDYGFYGQPAFWHSGDLTNS